MVEALRFPEAQLENPRHNLGCLLQNIKTDIASYIQKNDGSNKTTFLIIAGATSTGKSRIGRELSTIYPGTNLLDTDSFMLGRKSCLQLGITGEDPRAMNFEGLNEALKRLEKGESVSVHIYDHEKGEHTKWVEIPAGRLVVLEGIHALNENVNKPEFSRTVFLYYRDSTGEELVKEEKRKRGYTGEMIEEIVPQIMENSNRWISPAEESADFLIRVRRDRTYQSQKFFKQCYCSQS